MPPTRTPGAPLPDALADQLPESDRIGRVTARITGQGAAEIALYGAIGWDVTAAGVRAALKDIGPVTSLDIRINSNGGDVFEGFAIYNMLARAAAVRTVTVDGIAASMASFIAMAGTEIIMPSNAFMMIHNPSTIGVGDATQMRKCADLLDQLRAPMLATYTARTGRTPEEVAAMLDCETWFSGDQALEAGFADTVLAPVQAAATFDLSAFRNAPGAALALYTQQESPRMLTAVAPATITPPPPPAPVALAPVVPAVASLAELQALAQRGRLGADWIVAQLAAGATVDAARDAVIDAVVSPLPPINPANPRAVLLRDGDETLRDLKINALQCRANVPGVVLADGARQFRGMTLADVAQDCLEQVGIKTRGMTKMEIAEAALSPRRIYAAGGEHSSSDFPNLLANTASKSLRQAYIEAPRTFLPWATQHNLPDFKSFKAIALSGASDLQPISENGEVTFGTIGEGAETWSLARYGRAIAIGYVAIVNDDLSGFTRIPALFASASARLESDIVYNLVKANAALSDSVALFHATHGNLLTGAGSVLTADAAGISQLAAAEAKLNLQTAPNTTSPLNLTGQFLLVPTALSAVARQLASGQFSAVVPGSVNPYASQYDVIVEPRLQLGSGASSTAWYVLASPGSIDTIHYGYLEGEAGPRIAQDIDFDTDGVKIKVTHNFGAKAIDYRGMTKSAGA